MAGEIGMTPEEIQARSARAVRAATAAGRQLGLDVRNPVVLHDVFSVVVHLAPLPIVVRVPTVTPPGLRGALLAARQQRELDVVAWLAEQGVPVVSPSAHVPRRPVERDGFSMTFWELADVAGDHVPYGSVDSALVVVLHEGLREHTANDLPFLAPVNHTVPALLASLATTPDLIAAADLDRARREWEILGPLLASPDRFEERFPGVPLQPVHGDSPSYNVIQTRRGPLFADFEDVNLAPVEWDLAGGTAEDIQSYSHEASRRGLRPIDPEVLQVMSAGRMLQMVVSLALVPQLPLLAKGLEPAIEAWRAMPVAAGLV
jgi:hypothetical protein